MLPNLGVLDLVWVALLSGIPEEILFRGTLIPVVAPDLRGVLASALLFGYLHKSGGRSLAFAGWASAVGFLYGSAFLVTGKIAVPAIAHSGANCPANSATVCIAHGVAVGTALHADSCPKRCSPCMFGAQCTFERRRTRIV